MLVLHASFLAALDSAPDRFVVWGELTGDSQPPDKKPARRKSSRRQTEPVSLHPYAADAEGLIGVLNGFGAISAESATAYAALPSVGDFPKPSRRFLLPSEPEGATVLKNWRIEVASLKTPDALAFLAGLSAEDERTPSVEIGSDLAFWRVAGRFVLGLLAGQEFMPDLIERNGKYLAAWSPVIQGEDRVAFDDLIAVMPPAARAVAWKEEGPFLGPRALLTQFVNWSVDEVGRQAARLPKSRKAAATPGEKWLKALTSERQEVDLGRDFLDLYQKWRHPQGSAQDGNFRICFRLDPPEPQSDRGPEVAPAKKETEEKWNVRYMLQAEDDPSLLVPAEAVWRERGSTLRFLNRRFEMPQERLLGGLGLAERMFAPIRESLKVAQPTLSSLTTSEAFSFMREAAVLLNSSGFGVLMPDFAGKLSLRLKIATKRSSKSPKGPTPTGLSLEGIVAFDWQVALGDEVISKTDFEKLASLKVPLVKIRGEWVQFNPDQIKQAMDFLQARDGKGLMSVEQAMRATLDTEVAGLPVGAIEADGWIGELLDQASGKSQIKQLEPPKDFTGTLRPYQLLGFSWLAFLRRFGLGGCLADDMGLGKTIQTIALLLRVRDEGDKKPALLICPTSVVGNWEREIRRFAPSLKALIHHGSGRNKSGLAEASASADLVISSYALLHRDLAHLAEVEWGEVILDEAQNIKNPGTRQAQAARTLKAGHRIALTGTPVENRLSELWSIFQFLNPGYLGSQESFRSRFENPIVRLGDPEAARRLKSLTGPFLLRRVKTDPAVISDLPAKNEMKVYCNLTREQGTLYEAVVRDSVKLIEDSDGIKRRGVVLATLMKLKQVCNHPAQFMKDGSSIQDRSGKLNRLVEMLEEVRSVGDRALVFTQFAEMGAILKAHIESVFGVEILFLHGGTPASLRQRMVERFQDDPHGPFAFILSIKAGGTGLNLTRATSVFHFDRWWNPAVENQATDRAFRIGQKRSVQVYKYVCAGTVEERIDEMIEGKQALAGKIVGTSEAWITELSTDQLKDIFALRKESVE